MGTAVNSTGSAGPPNAPIAASQLIAMERAFKVAERNPQDVDYVECHATGMYNFFTIQYSYLIALQAQQRVILKKRIGLAKNFIVLMICILGASKGT